MPTISSGAKLDRGQIAASARGLISQNMPVEATGASQAMTGGTAYGVLLGLRGGDLVTNVHVVCSGAGSGTTLFKAAIFSPDGVTRYAVSNDQSSLFGATGTKTVPLSASWTAPADNGYMVVIVATASTTVPSILRQSLSSVATAVGSGALPYCTAGTGLSDVPAAGATLTAGGIGFWVAVS